MTLSCIAHVKRNKNSNNVRPAAPPLIAFIGSTWDRSGSMISTQGTAGPALYDWVKDACEQAKNLGQDCYLSATTFDDVAEKRFDNTHWSDVEISLTEANNWTTPRGTTALYDTAVNDINQLCKAAEDYKKNLKYAVSKLEPNIVIAWSLMTDGYDNSSVDCDHTTLADAVKTAREKGCHCYFLAANCDGEQRGVDYGFDVDNSLTFTADRNCSDSAFRGISQQLNRAVSGEDPEPIPTLLRTSSQGLPQNYYINDDGGSDDGANNLAPSMLRRH